MSYEKYIKRGRKVYGPYLYHSKKINGKVTSEYLGKGEEKKKRTFPIFMAIIIALLFLSLIIISVYNKNQIDFSKLFANIKNPFTGFSISDNLENESVEQPTEPIGLENNTTISQTTNNETTELVNETLIASNDTIVSEQNETTNETILVEEVNPVTNDTQGITSEPNVTEEINITIPLTPEVNITENITEQTNVTTTLTEQNATIQTIQYQAILNQPVKWKKQIVSEDIGNLTIKLPKEAENIIVNKIENQNREIVSPLSITGGVISSSSQGFFTRLLSFLGLTGKVIDSPEEKKEIEVGLEIDNIQAEYEVEYETPAPYAIEQDTETGKRVEIVGLESIHYENVLSFTDLNEVAKEKIRLYRITDGLKEPTAITNYIDTNSNGLIDKIEWITLQLSNETFEIIIEISKAEHLNSNREFISDIYEQVKALDDIWSETINDGEYVRVTFEQNLTNENDITLYPRVISGEPKIEVYEVDKTEKIAEFSSVTDNDYNTVYLTNLTEQDVFDLRVINGSLELDYIVDPMVGSTTGEMDIGVASLDNETIVIAYTNSSNVVAFQIWNTEGTLLLGPITVDTTNVPVTSSRVAVSAVNSTSFIVGWSNTTSYLLAGYSRSAGATYFAKNIVTAGNTTNTYKSDNDLTIAGGTLMYYFINWSRSGTPSSGNATAIARFDVTTGALIGATGSIVTGMAENIGGKLNNSISCDAINSTAVVCAEYASGTADDITWHIISTGGSEVLTDADVDTNVGNASGVAVTSLDGNRIVGVYLDVAENDVTFWINQTVPGAGVNPTDIDTNVGLTLNSTKVGIATVRNQSTNQDDFVVAYTNSTDLVAVGYNRLGQQSKAKFVVDTSPANSTFYVIGEQASNNNLCEGTWIIAYKNVSNVVQFKGYWLNGSAWNGTCLAPADIIKPMINITYPINRTNWSINTVDINYTYSDNIGVSSCWYSNDSRQNATLSNCANVTTVVWGDGIHNISVWVNDTSNNVNVSYITFTIDTTPPNINITYPPNNTQTFNTVDINYTVNDNNGIGVQACWYSNDSRQNATLANCANVTTVVWSGGIHNITVWANDSVGNKNKSEITFFVNLFAPNITRISWITVGGSTSNNLTYGQTILYFNATVNDSQSDTLSVNITLTDPDQVKVINSQPMSNTTYSFWNYSIPVTLEKAGNWTVNITATDGLNISSNSSIITVNIVKRTTREGWYGYSYGNVSSTNEINDLINYQFELLELQNNYSTLNASWVNVKAAINNSYNINVRTGLNIVWNYNYSIRDQETNATYNISKMFPELLGDPYSITMEYISIELVNVSGYTVSQLVNTSNTLAEAILMYTNNKFPVYVKNYNLSGFDSAYVRHTPMLYLTGTDGGNLINKEIATIKTNLSLNRIYYNLNSATKTTAMNTHIAYSTLRSAVNSTSLNEPNVISLNNMDVLVFNNLSSEHNYSLALSEIPYIIGKDAWTHADNYVIETDTDGTFNVSVDAYGISVVYFEDLDHVTISGLTSTAYKQTVPFTGNANYTKGQAQAGSWNLDLNNDILIDLYDPHYYEKTNFITYYGWLNVSKINYKELCDNSIIIIADKNNQEVDSLTANCTLSNPSAEIYGYVSVFDYSNTDAWFNNKTADVGNWTILNESMNLFIDGIDVGVGGTNFSSRMKDLVDYVQIQKNKKALLNTYTAYQNFSTWGTGGVMRESCVNRWNGASSTTPDNYSREDWSLELNKSAWLHSHNVKVICQAFNNRTTDGSYIISNYTELQDIYFASRVLGYDYFYLSQPDFNYPFTEYIYDVGDDLSSAPLTNDNETYYRLYSQGIIYYNKSSGHGWIDDGRVIQNSQVCFNLYDNNANPVTFNFNINKPGTTDTSDYDISDGNLSVGVWTNVCANISNPPNNGRYLIEAWVMPRSTLSGQGLAFGYVDYSNYSVYSYWDSSQPDNWNAYQSGRNWEVNVLLTDIKTASIDTSDKINQTNTFTAANVTINISSAYPFNISVFSDIISVDSSYTNLTYNGIQLNIADSNDCDNSNPTFANTTINEEIHGACRKLIGSNYSVRIRIPSLSERVYVITTIDTEYPQFSDYWDNNATQIGTGTGYFNVTVTSTNGTVILQFAGTNYTASNSSGDATVFNVTIFPISTGTYPYNWTAYGNGTSALFNISNHRYYTVNSSGQCSPALDEDWIIEDEQTCNGVEVTTGTGSTFITSTGLLYLINGANLTTRGLNVSGTGNKVFINIGGSIRI